MHGCADEYTEARPESSSAWNRSDPSLSYTTVERKPPSAKLHASVDDQLHEWGASWSSSQSALADPFGSDWAPKRLGYTP